MLLQVVAGVLVKQVLKNSKQHQWAIINISRTNCDIPDIVNFNIDLSKAGWSTHHGDALIETIHNADKICLVHNASIFNKDDVATQDENTFRQVLEFNLVSSLSLNKLFIPKMREGSSIIYIGSTLSEIAIPGRASYVISKHAQIGMMRSTCQDLSGKNITTCCICPGFVNTTMLTEHIDQNILDHLVKNKVTAKRLIEPQEIANVVYFCATHAVINAASPTCKFRAKSRAKAFVWHRFIVNSKLIPSKK